MRFAGQNIFGAPTRQVGPIAKTRNQREVLPGVRGYRVYDLVGTGADTLTFIITGRIIGTSLTVVERAVLRFIDMVGQIDRFESTGGIFYDNCELIDYRIVSDPNYLRCRIGNKDYYTAQIQATLEQAGG